VFPTDFAEIDRLKKIIDMRRPLDSELMATIAQKFREEWTYNTNALEGNTMTLQETTFFLREGLTVQGRTLKEHLEMKNHAEAIDFLEEAIKSRDLTEGLIKELHATLFLGIELFAGAESIKPGAYKIKDNHVLTLSGEIHHYVPAILVPEEMEKLITWYNENKLKMHPVELAALFHHKLVAIHPFTDGNGRISRLCMNYILMQKGYPPAIIRNERRKEYYLALEQADKGNPKAFIELVANEVKANLQLIVDNMR